MRPRFHRALPALAAFFLVGNLHAQTAAPAAFPMALITAEGTGPALYAGAGADAAGIGYVSGGVPIELTAAPTGDRALVRIRGGLRVRAHLPTSRLAAIVQRRGRIRGTPVYVGPGSVVRVLGFETDGRARVEASVKVAGSVHRYEGSFPSIGLGASNPAVAADQLPPGEPRILRITHEAPLLEAPGGATIITLAPGDYRCRIIETVDGLHSVLLGEGEGPYLLGHLRGEDIGPAPALTEPARVAAAFPARLRADSSLSLVRLAAGTRVTFEGETIALLDRPGYARIIERHDSTSEADVFVAVDDDVAVRGMVELGSLGEPIR